MLPRPIQDFIGTTEFRTGLVIGFVLLAGGFALASLRVGGLRARSVVPIGGLLIGAGFVLGVELTTNLPARVVAGLVLLAAGGSVADRLPRRRFGPLVASAALALPGAALLATETGSPREHWVAVLTVAAVVVGAPLTADFDRRFGRRGWPIAMYAISVVGVYFTVPDNARALVLFGVAVPIVLLGWPALVGSLGSAGSYVVVGALVWVGAFEGRGRHTAFIGAIACLGLLVAEPIARMLARRRTVLDDVPRRWWDVVPVAVAQLAVVYVASRIAGVRDALGASVVLAAIDLGVVVAVLALCPTPAARIQRGREQTSR